MRIGISLPVRELQNDLAAIREFAVTAEELGFTHLRVPDLVIRPGSGELHEPMTLLAWVAGFTSTIELVPSVIILPERQTALFAKQAAEVDILSGGRLRVGVGVGTNAEEYEALGQDFRTRGRRVEEQIELLRRLWTQESVELRRSLASRFGRRHRAAPRAAADSALGRPGLGRRPARGVGTAAGRPARGRLVRDHRSGARARSFGTDHRARARSRARSIADRDRGCDLRGRSPAPRSGSRTPMRGPRSALRTSACARLGRALTPRGTSRRCARRTPPSRRASSLNAIDSYARECPS